MPARRMGPAQQRSQPLRLLLRLMLLQLLLLLLPSGVPAARLALKSDQRDPRLGLPTVQPLLQQQPPVAPQQPQPQPQPQPQAVVASLQPPQQVAKAKTIPLLPYDPPTGRQPSFAICTIVKNQHTDLCEWLHYHLRVLNVTRIYFWDNNSRPPQHDIVAACSPPGTVVYRYVAGVPRTHSHFYGQPQLWAYNRCLQEFGAHHEFMAFIDADEFIVLRGKERNLDAYMAQFRPYGCLALNWRVFGSSGHVARPPGGVMENYHKCTNGQAQGRHTKCIVNTRFTLDAWNPHSFNYKPGYYCVNEAHVKTHTPYSETYAAANIALNHYVIKSRQDYAAKRARGSAMGNFKVAEYFDLTDAAATLDCNDTLPVGRQVAQEVARLQGQLQEASSGDAQFWEGVKQQHHARLFP